jgi:hypothetical protein
MEEAERLNLELPLKQVSINRKFVNFIIKY